MVGQLPGDPSHHEIASYTTSMYVPKELQCVTRQWYFSRQEIEDNSPSRKDGIDIETESHLRKLYCTFLQELGIELKVPQLTIATAMMLCHRFYMCQSHAKNDWQTIATVSMFLACKAEETPRWLSDLVVVSYKLIYRWDPSAPQRIKKREVYDKQKELILIGERLLLGTVAFDLNIEHPYKPLVSAIKRLEIAHKELAKVAWNFVNDWLRTTLCLQYKPHYISAGSMFLAAKFLKVKLPTAKGKVWWMQFDVSPKRLEEVTQQMLGLLEQNRKQAIPPKRGRVNESKPVVGKAMSNSPESCISSGSAIAQDSSNLQAGGHVNSAGSKSSQKQTCGDVHDTVKERLHCQTSDSGSVTSIVEDGDSDPIMGESDQNTSCKIVSVEVGYRKIDVNRIRETLKRRRGDRVANKKSEEATDEIDSEAWIEKELEKGIEPELASSEKRMKL